MPSGSYMATIQKRGRLIAGVSSDTLLLGARNPLNGQIEGFDIDMLKAVSKAIFGDPNKIEFRVITTAQRIPVLTDGSVDVVARAMTINCTRWAQIDFSTEYYLAGQKVLVAKGSTAKGMEDLKGKKVCAPNGSTSMDKLKTFAGLVPVGSDTHTGCLVLFQQGKVDAITGDDTILAGLAAQDPYAVVVKAPAFTKEPYGLGISKSHPDFVKFINGVLEQMRTDGQWTTAYDTWLKGALGPAPAPPAPVYGRATLITHTETAITPEPPGEDRHGDHARGRIALSRGPGCVARPAAGRARPARPGGARCTRRRLHDRRCPVVDGTVEGGRRSA